MNPSPSGDFYIEEGDIVFAQYKKAEGLKGFYSFFIDASESEDLEVVIEPELLEDISRNIHYPFSVLSNKLDKVLQRYKSAQRNRPPGHIKLMVNPGFISQGEPVSSNEYDLLLTISDYSKVSDIYENSPLIAFEITDALVSLRKKNAIRVLKVPKKVETGV